MRGRGPGAASASDSNSLAEHHGETPPSAPTSEKSTWAWLKEMPLMLGSGRLCSLSHSARGRQEGAQGLGGRAVWQVCLGDSGWLTSQPLARGPSVP